MTYTHILRPPLISENINGYCRTNIPNYKFWSVLSCLPYDSFAKDVCAKGWNIQTARTTCHAS
ncbi:unnamed protein product [Acanthoscelides obtectus]|uniref:Uncharacterized protein n=1 Tax=Acanthoscelides obtectus TaxID=200917 RepID=A0A9P0JMH2_ACAOB|nr:unnamed protein product [Acanthoscelides obtectus]CAK1649952.1 hypothetical protein AOBTE_LOCUS16512 [Acanthoscelides obtectus]